jgi:hypothetical protein
MNITLYSEVGRSTSCALQRELAAALGDLRCVRAGVEGR